MATLDLSDLFPVPAGAVSAGYAPTDEAGAAAIARHISGYNGAQHNLGHSFSHDLSVPSWTGPLGTYIIAEQEGGWVVYRMP